MSTEARGVPAVEPHRARVGAVLAAADRINRDVGGVAEALADLRPVLERHAGETVNRTHRRPHAARLLVARDLRRAVFIAIGHRYAVATLPMALELLSGEQPPWWPPAAGTAGARPMHGARGRVFTGGVAALGTVLREVFELPRHRMFRDMPAPEADLLRSTVRRLTLETKAAADAAHREEFGAAWQDPAARLSPYAAGAGRRPFRSRTLAFLANGLSPSLDASLAGSELGQAEHFAVGITDLVAALDAASCPAPHRFPAALAGVTGLGDLAALRDEVAQRLLFRPGPRRTIYRAERDPASATWRVRPIVPPLSSSPRDRPGRCPSIEVLRPIRERDRTLVAAAYRTTGHPPATGVAAADAAALLALAVAHRMGVLA